jgi:hypothetical protein
MVKKFLQISVGCQIRVVVRDSCLNPNIKNRHLNINMKMKIEKPYHHLQIHNYKGGYKKVLAYGNTPLLIPSILSPSPLHLHSFSLSHNFFPHTSSFIPKPF